MKNKYDIDVHLRRYKPHIPIDYDELMNFPDIDESDGQEESSHFNVVNPDLIDFNVISNRDSNHNSVPSFTVESLLLPPEQFYSMCSQLNNAHKCTLHYEI